jgi:ferredoxin
LESGVKFISGVARLALETRENQENKCISCGGCMTGCSRGTVYCSASDFDRFKSIGIVNHHVIAKVLSFDRAQRTLKIFKDNTIEITPSFDRIYLGAGCLGTSEIIMRSFEIADGPVMQDNTVFTFPLFYFGRTEARARLENSQVLTNLVIGRIPSAPNSALTQIQFYSTFEHLWRYYLPPIIWPVADWFGHFLKSRLVWGRIYLPGDQSQHYSLHLEGDDKLELKLAKKGGAKADLMPILNDLKAMLAGSGFVIPPIGPIRHPTSSHYAATFPYGGNLLNLPPSGEVSPGIFICDSTVFNQSPSISPTFTIMANAWRTADQSLLY